MLNLKNKNTMLNKVNEDGTSALKSKIAKRSFRLASKLGSLDDSEESQLSAVKLSGAISLLTQAQILAETNSKDALRLYNVAERLY